MSLALLILLCTINCLYSKAGTEPKLRSVANASYKHVRIHLLAYLSQAHFLLTHFPFLVYSPCPKWPLTFNVLIFLLSFLYLYFNRWFCLFSVFAPYNFGKCGLDCLSPCKSYCEFLWNKTIPRLSENEIILMLFWFLNMNK